MNTFTLVEKELMLSHFTSVKQNNDESPITSTGLEIENTAGAIV
jgi:hypothetical protein